MCHCAYKCAPIAISGVVDIPKVSWCHLLKQIRFQRGSQKLLQALVSHGLLAYLSDFYSFFDSFDFLKVHKPDNSGSRNSLKLSFTIIEGVRPNFVGRKSFFESISPDILALCEANLHETF